MSERALGLLIEQKRHERDRRRLALAEVQRKRADGAEALRAWSDRVAAECARGVHPDLFYDIQGYLAAARKEETRLQARLDAALEEEARAQGWLREADREVERLNRIRALRAEAARREERRRERKRHDDVVQSLRRFRSQVGA